MGKIVVVINFWGGAPTCLLSRAFETLPGFKCWCSGGNMYRRTYLSNTDEISSFKEFIKKDNTTVFEEIKKKGYKTILLGCFGLNEDLNPDPVRQSFVVDAESSLQKYGIDVFSNMDGAYYKGSALSHDRHVIRDAIDIISDNKDEPIFLFINLLGCRDVVRKRFYNPNMKISDYICNNWEKDINIEDERLIPQSVRFLGNTKLDNFIRRCKLSKDKIYGEDCVDDYLHPKEKFHALQKSTWDDMCCLNEYLYSLYNVLCDKYENVLSGIVSTKSVSLEEHSIRVSAPVEACCRSFWCLSNNNSDRKVETNDDPYCVNDFWNFLYKRMDINTNFKIDPPVTTCILDFASVNADNYCMRFIVELKGRTYIVVSLWSLKDIAYESNISSSISDDDIVNICSKKNCLPVPDVKIASVFSITEDPDELEDIKENISQELLYELSNHCNMCKKPITDFKLSHSEADVKKVDKSIIKKIKFDTNAPRTYNIPPPSPPKVIQKQNIQRQNMKNREQQLHQRHR